MVGDGRESGRADEPGGHLGLIIAKSRIVDSIRRTVGTLED